MPLLLSLKLKISIARSSPRDVHVQALPVRTDLNLLLSLSSLRKIQPIPKRKLRHSSTLKRKSPTLRLLFRALWILSLRISPTMPISERNSVHSQAKRAKWYQKPLTLKLKAFTPTITNMPSLSRKSPITVSSLWTEAKRKAS